MARNQIVHDSTTLIPAFDDGIVASYHPDYLVPDIAEDLQKHLATIPFTRVSYPKYGTVRRTPRMTYCYGQFNSEPIARYRGKDFTTEPLPVWLDTLRHSVETTTGRQFNAVILNYYPDGDNYIGWHQDDETFLGHKVVASISLGQSRDFLFKAAVGSPVHRITLMDRSLFLIDQGLWHSLPKRVHVEQPRYNITFRNVNSTTGVGNYYYYNRGTPLN
jgi:alkylated DNA repair dioxygenase AlkB